MASSVVREPADSTFMPSPADGLAVMCVSRWIGEVTGVTTHMNEAPIGGELFRAASAVLGGDRAKQLRDALVERAEQFARVRGAAEAVRQRIRPTALVSPGPSSVAAWRGCRERIESLDERLRAWAWVVPAEQEVGSDGATGALDGHVAGVKDVIDVAGMPTRAGSLLTPPGPVQADATAVARLRRAGAAIAGKTQCTQWALNDPAPTRNPWDPGRTPGGSSAGSAVAVAVGMCTATVDTQTAGDVLRPAAYNGVVGFKPTMGWVTAEGSQPVAPSIDTIGVTARRVADAAAVAAAIADDPVRFRHGTASSAPRIGVLTGPYVEDLGPAVRANFRHTLRRLTDAGAELVTVSCPVDLSLVHAAHRIVTFAECAAEHLAAGRGDLVGYGPRARELIDLGMVTPAHAYLHAQHVRQDATRRLAAMFADVDVVVLPVVPEPAPGRATTGDSRLQIPWTLCGFPALSLPAGLSPAGLPLAVQFLAGLHHEPALLAAASWSEQVLGVELAVLLH
jgi:Asp-tRNA(Asn)/Glu-tRNA(Gln) amidotransferase A subunit family amidase